MKKITLFIFTVLYSALLYAQKPYYNIKYNGRGYEVSYTSYDKTVTIYPLLEDVYKDKEYIDMNVDGFQFQFNRPGDNVTARWKEKIVEYVDPKMHKGTISMKIGYVDKLLAEYDATIDFYNSVKEQKIKSVKEPSQLFLLSALCSSLPKGSKEKIDAMELANKGKIKEPLISLSAKRVTLLETDKSKLIAIKELSQTDPTAFLRSTFPKSLYNDFDDYSNHQLNHSGDVRNIAVSKKTLRFLNPYISKDSLVINNPNYEDSCTVKLYSIFGKPGYDKDLINFVYSTAFKENRYNIQKGNCVGQALYQIVVRNDS